MQNAIVHHTSIKAPRERYTAAAAAASRHLSAVLKREKAMTDGSGRLLDSLKDKVHDAEYSFLKLERSSKRREIRRLGCQRRGEQRFRVLRNREALATQKRKNNSPSWVPDEYLPSNASRSRRREKAFVRACLKHEDPDTEALARGFDVLERLLAGDGGLSPKIRFEAANERRAEEERAAANAVVVEKFLPTWTSDLDAVDNK